jgi:hypothetical protein
MFYGPDFLSVSALFEALPDGQSPILIQKSSSLLNFHGWKPAVGSVFATSFDGTIAFPLNYPPLIEFAKRAKALQEKNATKRREKHVLLWEEISVANRVVRESLKVAEDLLRKSLTTKPNKWYTPEIVHDLQSKCYSGRCRCADIHPSNTRYRKGIQHLFILQETLKVKSATDQSAWNWAIQGPRINLARLPEILGVPVKSVESIVSILSNIPVKMDRGTMTPLVNAKAGMNAVSLDSDLSHFALALQRLPTVAKTRFKNALDKLFCLYRETEGVVDAIRDLSDDKRVRQKVLYVLTAVDKCNGDRDQFVRLIIEEAIRSGHIPPHQKFLHDENNWFIETLFAAYDIRRKQDIVAHLPDVFDERTGESLRRYAFKGNVDQFVNHLIQGIRLSRYFRKDVALSESEVVQVSLQALAELLWKRMQAVKTPEPDTACKSYRVRKTTRIIAQSDLEPITYLLKESLPHLAKNTPLRGFFADYAKSKGWARAALTTDVVGCLTDQSVIGMSQAVMGRKHIADKTREIAARLRSVLLRHENDSMQPAAESGYMYLLIVDGDWPIESKINLYESGYTWIFEIAELNLLADVLKALPKLSEQTEK